MSRKDTCSVGAKTTKKQLASSCYISISTKNHKTKGQQSQTREEAWVPESPHGREPPTVQEHSFGL